MEYMSPIGTVKVRLLDYQGKIKEEKITHNIITTQGDAYIADLLSLVPVRQKINATNCFIVVGTGYTGLDTKNRTWVLTQTGSAKAVDTGYPQTGAAWGEIGQNQLNFQFTYALGSLSATGINEAALVSAFTETSATTCLAYAQIPSVNVAISDSLQIFWTITFLGS